METDDGAEIFFEASGYGVETSAKGSNTLLFGMALRFEEPEAPHEWLGDTIFTLEGELATSSGRGRYRVFVPGRSAREF